MNVSATANLWKVESVKSRKKNLISCFVAFGCYHGTHITRAVVFAVSVDREQINRASSKLLVSSWLQSVLLIFTCRPTPFTFLSVVTVCGIACSPSGVLCQCSSVKLPGLSDTEHRDHQKVIHPANDLCPRTHLTLDRVTPSTCILCCVRRSEALLIVTTAVIRGGSGWNF